MTGLTSHIGNSTGNAESLAVLVGERVREARVRQGITRKRLSELSEVSLRYLAQLENGEGNISVVLLQKVALALEHPVDWFVCEDDFWQSNSRHLIERFRLAEPRIQQQVLQLLKPAGDNTAKAKRVCLIGLRGAGKSTLGSAVGAELGVAFVELNTEISALAGMPIDELMSLFGQEGYRRLERQALERIVKTDSQIILAAAGGVVADAQTYQYLQTHFHTVWLKASAEEHMARVRAQGDERPMTGNPKAMEQLVSILTGREALYASADCMVDTSGKLLSQSRSDVLDAVRAIL